MSTKKGLLLGGLFFSGDGLQIQHSWSLKHGRFLLTQWRKEY